MRLPMEKLLLIINVIFENVEILNIISYEVKRRTKADKKNCGYAHYRMVEFILIGNVT